MKGMRHLWKILNGSVRTFEKLNQKFKNKEENIMGIKVKSKLNYRQRVTDNVTGFKGTVVAISQWQQGCVRIGVQPEIGEDGKMPDVQWIDEPQLTGEIAKAPHGPQQDMKRNFDPTR